MRDRLAMLAASNAERARLCNAAGLRPFAHGPHMHVLHVQYYFRLLLLPWFCKGVQASLLLPAAEIEHMEPVQSDWTLRVGLNANCRARSAIVCQCLCPRAGSCMYTNMQHLRNGIETDRQPSVDRLEPNASLPGSLWSVVNEHFLMLTVQIAKRYRLSCLDKATPHTTISGTGRCGVRLKFAFTLETSSPVVGETIPPFVMVNALLNEEVSKAARRASGVITKYLDS